MKIMLCCRVYPTHRAGGMPFVVQDRAKALTAAGHEVVVVTTGAKSREPCKTESGHIIYADSKPEVYSDEYAECCLRAYYQIKPAIVHLDSLDLHRQWYTKVGTAKTAVTLHGFAWGAFLTQWNLYRLGRGEKPLFDAVGFMREWKALTTFDTVIGISRHEHWMLRDMFGLTQAKLVYNPIPSYFFENISTEQPKQRSFVCAAISGQDKRLFEVAQQAASLAGFKLDVASKVLRPNMPIVYDQHSALIVPTAYAQGADLGACEAVARRRPLLLSATGSYLRESEPGGIWEKCSVVTPLGDIEALADAMSGPLPEVPPDAADIHKPENHVKNWLAALGF